MLQKEMLTLFFEANRSKTCTLILKIALLFHYLLTFHQYVLCPDNWIFLNHGHYQKGRYVEIKEIIQIPMRAKFANYFLKCIVG